MKCVASELYHKVPSFGFIFQEPETKGLLDKGKLKSLGLLNSKLCGDLAKGKCVEKDGKIITPTDVYRPNVPGRKVAILGDCSDSSRSVGPCFQSDLLLHESTLEDELRESAMDHGHSTPG